MSLQEVKIPQIIDPAILADLIQRMINPLATQEGGNSIFNFVLDASTDDQLVLKINKYRKSLTIINNDTVDVDIRRLYQGNVQVIPLPSGASIEFEPIKIGKISRCIEGVELEQDVIRCEFMGELRIDNPNAVPVDIVVVEVC